MCKYIITQGFFWIKFNIKIYQDEGQMRGKKWFTTKILQNIGTSDLSGVMSDPELHGAHPGPGVELVESVVVVALLQERNVRGLKVREMLNLLQIFTILLPIPIRHIYLD